MAVDAEDPDTVVVSAAQGPRQAHRTGSAESAIYRRTGEGTWQECRQGLPEPTGILAPLVAASETQPGVFYAASNRGFYHSENAGKSWDRLEIDWPGRYRNQRLQAFLAVE